MNVEPETMLLGALAFDNSRIDAVADILAPEDFSNGLYGDLYGLMLSERGQGRPAALPALRPLIAAHPSYKAVGGDQWLGSLLTQSSPGIAPLEVAKLIVRAAKRARLKQGLSDSIAAIADANNTLEEVVELADEAIVTATYDPASAIELTAGKCMARLLDGYADAKAGVRCTTIPSIDKVLGSLRPKQLIIMAGRPGMGKTAAALSYALGAAQGGHGTLFVSLEMSGEELAARMAADLNFTGSDGLPFAEVLADSPPDHVKRRIARAAVELDDMPLSVIDTGKLTIGRLHMMVRRHVRRMAARGEKLELVVVDYLQLLSSDSKARSAYETVSEISRGLKQLAKDCGVAVLALAQLSRDVEKRPDRRPQLSDLRDSGQIEQDADAVLFLLREEYYLRQEEPEAGTADHITWQDMLSKVENRLEFICAKRRNGVTGKAQGFFYGRYQAVRG